MSFIERSKIHKGIESVMRKPTIRFIELVRDRVSNKYNERPTMLDVERELVAIADYLLDESFFTDEE